MLKQNLIAAAFLAVLAIPTLAQEPGAPKAPPRPYGYELMTPEERQAYTDKMRAAKTPEERAKLRDEHRAEMQKRAKEKGVTLPEPGPRAGAGPGGPGGRGQMQELFTQDERNEFRKRMEAAKTPEERAKIREEQRAIAQTRAKEKGITLPEPRGPGGGPGGRGQMHGQELFTPEERDAFRKQMQEAKTPEERAKLRDEHRTLAQARAKEKGITLPEPRGPRGPGPGGGPGPGPGPAPAAPKAQ